LVSVGVLRILLAVVGVVVNVVVLLDVHFKGQLEGIIFVIGVLLELLHLPVLLGVLLQLTHRLLKFMSFSLLLRV
jgi:hypothetical protein